jgi:hypothetical protein
VEEPQSRGGSTRLTRLRPRGTYVEAGIGYCEDSGLELWRELLSANRLRLELDRGRWDRAGEAANGLLSDPRCTVSVRSEALVTLGLVRARRGDPEIWAPLDEALALAFSSDVTQAFATVAAACAEAACLQNKSTDVAGITDNAFALTLARDAPWITGELAVWRWRAGIRDALLPGKAAEPYALSIAGEGARAASLWQQIGCPYEAALALADSGDERPLRDALDQLRALGARPAAAIVARRLRQQGARGLRSPLPHTPEPRWPDCTRARSAGPAHRGIAQRSDRRALGCVRKNCRSSRFGEPRKTERPHTICRNTPSHIMYPTR